MDVEKMHVLRVVYVKAGGEWSWCRFTKAVGAVRQHVPARVTREVLLRLVGDLEAAAK